MIQTTLEKIVNEALKNKGKIGVENVHSISDEIAVVANEMEQSYHIYLELQMENGKQFFLRKEKFY